MKTLNALFKLIAVLAAVAGVIYLLIAYSDKIAAWLQSFSESASSDADQEACDTDNNETLSQENDAQAVADASDVAAPVADDADFES